MWIIHMAGEGRSLDMLLIIGHSDGPFARLVRLEGGRIHAVLHLHGANESAAGRRVGRHVNITSAHTIAVDLKQTEKNYAALERRLHGKKWIKQKDKWIKGVGNGQGKYMDSRVQNVGRVTNVFLGEIWTLSLGKHSEKEVLAYDFLFWKSLIVIFLTSWLNENF